MKVLKKGDNMTDRSEFERIHIIYLDDSANDAMLLDHFLYKNECNVQIAWISDPQYYLELLKMEMLTHLKLILADLRMPIYDGIYCLQETKKLESMSRVPFVIYSSSAHENDVNKAYKCGCNAYLIKENNIKEITTQLNLVINYWLQNKN